MFFTAVLPPEVIDRIVTIFGDVELRSPKWGQLGPEKRHLGIFSLICRHWARRCRPQMFDEITLRDRDDLFRFLSLVDSPVQASPPLIECVHAVVLSSAGPWSQPWLHLVSAEISKRKEALDEPSREEIDEITFKLDGVHVPQANEASSANTGFGYAPRSWCTGLPRSLPSGVFPIETMELSKLRFRTPAGLIRLIRSTPSLKDLQCTHLVFDDWSDPAFETVGQARQSPNCLHTIAGHGCGSEAQNLDLVLLISRSQMPHALVKPGLRPFSGWAHLRQLAHSVLLTHTSTRVELRAMFVPRSRPTSCGEQRHALSSSVAHAVQDVLVDYFRPDASQEVPTRFKHIHGVTLSLQLTADPTPLAVVHAIGLFGLSALDETQAIDWPALETAVAALAPAEPTTVRVRGLDAFLWLLDAVPAKTILHSLYSARRLVVEHRSRAPRITLESVLAAPAAYTIDGGTVALSRAQVVQLASCVGESAREDFLRNVLWAYA
ncbi:hypothetical protein PHLGIDRAFT_114846 [Phlebiopsis gigantea 11061_1 CR5-6]|uniref:Uncharacterized protein n=1 Tax=Phlebiopsis gigantea (strain 11061_1 CR5-6) TaxID=745531 RepID=A0A0C3SEZ4_PHLG1|nr:hypothetical protein PHLGIDRAFT_114846 [Phlebiopsis gigantea 11061_1 CR5-6]